MNHEIEISLVESSGDIPFNLLLLADPSRKNIEKYVSDSFIYTATINRQVIGCYVLYLLDKATIEIKNIAVDESFQGKGIGTRLLFDAFGKAKRYGAKKIVIGTGNSSLGQLYLYQKAGFRIAEIKHNFFIDNYEEAIWENGIQCRDMIVLAKEL